MKLKRGSTSVRRLIFIGDSSSTTGTGLASLVYNSAGLVAYYFAGDLSDEVQITLVSGTLGTFASGGFVAVDNSNMPGWYEIGIPNAALDGGNEACIQLRGATNMVPVNIYIELDAVDYQNATDFGLSRLDATVSSRSTLDAAGVRSAAGLASANLDTQLGGLDNTLASVDSATSNIQAKTDQLQFDGDGYLYVDMVSLNSDPLLVGKLAAFADGGVESSGFVNVASLAANSIGSGELAASAIAEIQSGLATASALSTLAGYVDTEVAAIKVTTDKLDTMLVQDGLVWQFTTNALELGPSGGGGGGTGARTVTITVTLDTGGNVEGATVRLSKAAETYTATTDVDGECVFNVDDGTWTVAITTSNATFAGTTLLVNDDETASYKMTAISITASDVGKRTGYYTCFDEDGVVESGVDVVCRCQSGAGTTGLALDSKDRTETSNAEGLVQFTNLIVGVRYRFRRGSGNWQEFTVVAGSGAFAISSLLGKDA